MLLHEFTTFPHTDKFLTYFWFFMTTNHTQLNICVHLIILYFMLFYV